MTSIHNPFLGRDLQEKLARQTSEKITHKTWSLLKCFSVVVVIVAVCCFWFFRCFFPKRSTLNNELFAQNTWQFPKLWRLQPFGLKHAVFNCFRTESLYRAVASMEQDETIASSWVWPFMKKRFIEKKKLECLRCNQTLRWKMNNSPMLSKSKACRKKWVIALNNFYPNRYGPFYSFCCPFHLAPAHASVPSAHREVLKPCPEEAWLMLNGLTSAYVDKPTNPLQKEN